MSLLSKELLNLKNMSSLQIIFIVLIIIYILSGVNVPYNLTQYLHLLLHPDFLIITH